MDEYFFIQPLSLVPFDEEFSLRFVFRRHHASRQFRKLDDAYATATPLNWTGISPISGKTLQDFILKKQRGDDDSGQLNLGY